MTAPTLILLGVTGSIAAPKATTLLRLLQKRGYRVAVAMTPAATEFVGPLTFESLSGTPVYLSPVAIHPASDSEKTCGIGHTRMTELAAALVVAPATADCLAKLAHGFGDDPVAVLSLALDEAAPLIVAPAMNPRMWRNPAVRANVARLKARGAFIIGPAEGEVACGDLGVGRMSEPEEIAAGVARALALTRRRLERPDARPRRVLILSGPTQEPIDEVRFISNGSSGRMGAALAAAAYEAGDEVTVISGPAAVMPPAWVRTIRVRTAAEMLAAAQAEPWDLLVSPAAVADYRPLKPARGKPAKKKSLTLSLTVTPDVLATLAKQKPRGARVVAFAAEENAENIGAARQKGRKKNADYVVLNEARAAMGAEDTLVRVIEVKSGKARTLGPATKEAVARELWEALGD